MNGELMHFVLIKNPSLDFKKTLYQVIVYLFSELVNLAQEPLAITMIYDLQGNSSQVSVNICT